MKYLITLILFILLSLPAQTVIGTTESKSTTLQSGFWFTTLKTAPAAITDNLPREYALYQNYPNPFNPSTVINYDLPQAGLVKLTVYDILGREVAVLDAGIKPAGKQSIVFNAADYASGLYFYQLQTGEFNKVKRMVIAK